MKTQSALKSTRNTQVLLPHEDDCLPLEDDEPVCRLSHKLVDELDEDTVTMLAKVLGGQVCHLILALDVADADFFLFCQLLQESVPQHDRLCARTVVKAAGDEQHGRLIDV